MAHTLEPTIEVSDSVAAFTPEVELTLRRLRDHLIEGEREPETPGESPVRTYALHPAARLALTAPGGVR